MKKYMFLDGKLDTVDICPNSIQYISYVIHEPYEVQNVNSNNEIVTEVRINEMTEELFKCHHCNVFCTYNHTKNPVFNRDCNFKYNWLCNSCAFLNYISNNDKIK